MLYQIWYAIFKILTQLVDFTKRTYVRRAAITLEHWFLERSQHYPKARLEKIQRAKFGDIVRSLDQVPVTQGAKQKDQKSLSDWPILERSAVQQIGEAAYKNQSLPPYRFYAEHTSGSTSAQLNFFEDTATIPLRVARYRRQRRWIEGDQTSTLVRLMNRERLGFEEEGLCMTLQPGESFEAGIERLYTTLKTREKDGAIFLESISGYLLRLAQLIHHEGLTPVQVTGLLTFGERLLPAEVAFIESVFATKIYNRYSLREFSTVAQESPDTDGALQVVAEHFIVEILDEAGSPVPPDTEGSVVVTSLVNHAMPFIRYQTGDRGMLLSGTSDINALPLLKLTGRSVGAPESEKAIIFERVIPPIAELMVARGMYQVVHQEGESVCLRVALFDTSAEREVRAAIASVVRPMLPKTATFTIEAVPTIPLSPNGKRVLYTTT